MLQSHGVRLEAEDEYVVLGSVRFGSWENNTGAK